jgi:hypothetical protein
MNGPLLIPLAVAALILLIGGIISYRVAAVQERNRLDQGLSQALAKRPVILNPIFIGYIALAALLLAVTAYYFGVFEPAA